MTASNSIDIDGQTEGERLVHPSAASIDDLDSAEAIGTGGVVSNFPPLEGTGAGTTTQETIELEISADRISSRLEKNLLVGASL